MLTNFTDVKSNKLIIFLTGWGCDNKQFENMFKTCKNYDILTCWDYSDIKFEPNINFLNYDEIYLLAYSAGVFVAGLIQDNLPKITKSIAINGNPLMFDEYFGISSDILNIFRSLNLDNFIDFRRQYLVTTEAELKFFNEHSSLRTFESCDKELDNLEKLYKEGFKPYVFDYAILGSKDKIFNPKTQIEYFKDKYVIECAHNIFYHYQTFDEILNLV